MKQQTHKLYLSLSLLISDFVLFVFFVLQAEKHSFCNILAFILCLALPVLFVWFLVCLVKLIIFCIKNKTNQPVSKEDNKHRKYNYSYENYKTPEKQIDLIDIEDYKKLYIKNSQNDRVRIKRAKYECFSFIDFDEKNYKTTVINAEQTQKYKTTIKNCTCGDFKDRGLPCKHMYRLADYCSVFPIYKDGERDIVNRLMILYQHQNLIPYLIDIFYRIIEKKNKYYLKITPNIKKLAELNLIKLNDIPPYDFVDWKYNTNELKGLLYEKFSKKSISKKELIDLFISDEKLLKKLPQNIKHITLNFDENKQDEIIECLNYMNYHD